MGRIRTVKPEFWTDEKVGELKRDERLLFLGLLNLADDEGVLKATPAFIKGQIFAYDEDLTIADVRQWLDALLVAKMLIGFDYNNEKFFLIRTFKAHQKINRPTPSKIPKNILESVLNESSLITHGGLSEDSVPERKGKEEEIEIEGEEEHEDSSHLVDNDLINKIMKYFGFTETANFDKMRDVLSFLKCISIADRISYFEEQFDAYIEYKELNDSFVHSFARFLGNQKSLFTDGAWNAENWVHKLEAERQKVNKPKNQSDSNRGVLAAQEWADVKRNR